MNKIAAYVRTKSAPFYLKLTAYILAIVSAVVYQVIDKGDPTYSNTAFLLVLAGGILGILILLLGAFVKAPILSLIPVLLFAVGLGKHLYASLPPISDLFTNVVLFGGNQKLGILFIVLFSVSLIVTIVCSFLSDEKRA